MCAKKCVVMAESTQGLLICSAMMETESMEMGALLIALMRKGMPAQEDHQSSQIHAYRSVVMGSKLQERDAMTETLSMEMAALATALLKKDFLVLMEHILQVTLHAMRFVDMV